LLYNGVDQWEIGHENGADLSMILRCAVGSGPTEGGGTVTREGT
jgi:hypothetical protein